ncbi:MAG: glycosyltransferase 87 family protein [Nitrospirales bacterium]
MKNILAGHFRKLSPITLGLLLFAICNLVMNLALIRHGTVLQQTWSFLTFSRIGLAHDSWEEMFQALEYLQSNHENLIYSQLFFNDRVKFQYPLTSLLPLFLLKQFTSDYHTQLYILNFLSSIAIITTAIFAVRIFNLKLNSFSATPSSEKFGLDVFIRTFLLLLLCFMFYPLVKAHALGQIQVFINCFFTLSVWFWLKRQEHISGILIGIIILIKPQYVLIAIWGVLRKRYSFAISLFGVFLSGLLCSAFLFGISNNLDYLSVLNFISSTGEGFYPNQSMNGLLNRLLFNGNNLQWERHVFAPFNPIVYVGTLLSSALLILGALIGFARIGLRGGVIDFMIIALSCTIASPVAWEHHYGILLIIFAFLLPYLLSQPDFGRSAMLFFVLSYTLASNFFGIFNRLAYVPVLNIIQSYLFIAALIVLVFLYGIGDRRGQAKREPVPKHPR